MLPTDVTRAVGFVPTEHPHRRLNLLTNEWVLVSPHRTKRPWQGQVERMPPDERPAYDPKCYLCPGNERAGGNQTPPYTSTFVFDNDFAALLPEGPRGDASRGPLFRQQAETGICRVICFHPRHNLTLPEMEPAEIRTVVDTWAQQVVELGERPDISYVQVFENKGAAMGASNPHPHGQVWASYTVPQEPAKEDASQFAYFRANERPLLMDYLAAEIDAAERGAGERIVVENDHWVALCPWWAVWPFETILLPRAHVTSLPALNDAQRDALATILKRLLIRYDNLFESSFPYSMGWHGEPTDNSEHAYWQLHAHFYPPLLRSATVRKFMVGYELLANPQRDITPEQAAARLRELSEVHYRSRG
jgi:UDPglucose--hexose-1-phosphate uridylyltransferase